MFTGFCANAGRQDHKDDDSDGDAIRWIDRLMKGKDTSEEKTNEDLCADTDTLEK